MKLIVQIIIIHQTQINNNHIMLQNKTMAPILEFL